MTEPEHVNWWKESIKDLYVDWSGGFKVEVLTDEEYRVAMEAEAAYRDNLKEGE